MVLALLLTASAAAQPSVRRSLGAAETIPLQRVDGDRRPVTLAEFSPGPLVLYFYGPECSDCTEQLAYLQRLQRTGPVHGQLKVVAVAVTFGPTTRSYALGELPSLVDQGGRVWSALMRQDGLIDSPPGAREGHRKVLPVTVYVGKWAVRHYGSTRMSLDQFVTRRRQLLHALRLPPPRVAEIDIDDDEALRFFDWDTPRTDGGVPAAAGR